MAGGAELRGADNLVRTLHDAAGQLVDDLPDVERQAGELLASSAAQVAPRDTGLLASRHGYTVVAELLTVTAATAYAALVHARNPWLARTVDAKADQVADLYLAGVADALAQVKGV